MWKTDLGRSFVVKVLLESGSFMSPWYRLALSIVLLGVMIFAWQTRFDELIYHSVARNKLIEIGDATNFNEIKETIKPNSYVQLSGILGNKAASISGLRAGSLSFGRFQIRHLLGSNLYIEYPEGKYHPIFNPFTRVTVRGRLTSFGPDSEMNKVREFFKKHYHKAIDDSAMLVVVDEEPQSQARYAVLFLISLAILALSFYFSLRGLLRKDHN